MKRIISIILIIATLFTFAACNNLNTLPKKEEAPYPSPQSLGGYAITGVISDQSGNGLPNVAVMSGDKVRAVTDSKGEYKITGLSGSVKITPKFADYTFTNSEVTVNGGGTVNFVGKNKYSVSARIQFSDGSAFYQGVFSVGGKNYAATEGGTAFFDNRNGKTTVTPVSDAFDFSPSSKDVYTGETITFTAKPKTDTFSVSGKIDASKITKVENIPQLYIAVNGKKYTDVSVNFSYDENGNALPQLTYSVKGLKSNPKEGYRISMIDADGNTSAETFTVNEATENLNFKLNITRKFNIKLRPLNTSTVTGYNSRYLDYSLTVKDESGNVVKKYYGSDLLFEDLTAWAGCTIVLEGEYYDRTNSVHLMYDDWLNVSDAMMRDTETVEYEITFRMTNYTES